MATLLAPYNTAMKLGSGFNSFTQQLCVDHAVVSDLAVLDELAGPGEPKQIAQEVSYKTSIVDKASDVTKAMNINAAFSIKYDEFHASGQAKFLNTSAIKESDLTFMINVKVVNQVIYDHSLTQFQTVSGLKNSPNFVDVYGDCFISGFQEGGEFTALISIKVKDRAAVDDMKINAAIEFTKENTDNKKVNLEGDFKKSSNDFLSEHETTISVAWTGGGQNLKTSTEDWTFGTMKAAALKFPELVAKTPMRTHAILTKYTALRSFHSQPQPTILPAYEKAGVYTSILQDAYLDYKTISKNLQVLAYDASAGLQTLAAAVKSITLVAEKDTTTAVDTDSAPAKSTALSNGLTKEASTSDDDSVALLGDETVGSVTKPLIIREPYEPTVEGLEAARIHCRYMMNRIVSEVDVVTRNPDVATDEHRLLPYMSPFLFKQLLPVGLPIPGKDQAAAIAPVANPDDATSKITGNIKFM